MKAKIHTNIEVSDSEIVIGKQTLSEILDIIYNKTQNSVQAISIARQTENPNLEDLDSDLCAVLNLIEEIRKY